MHIRELHLCLPCLALLFRQLILERSEKKLGLTKAEKDAGLDVVNTTVTNFYMIDLGTCGWLKRCRRTHLDNAPDAKTRACTALMHAASPLI